MRLLLVVATAPEIAPLLVEIGPARPSSEGTRVRRFAYGGHDVDVLTTGVGMVATAAWCARTLATTQYDLAVNAGVCGSFDPALPPGTVVNVVADTLAELGAEDGDRLLSLAELGLGGEPAVANPDVPDNAVLRALPAVSGITVNTVHGRESSIVEVVERHCPQVESMEGAAFMYACRMSGVPFAQVRAVSNVVERRNRAAWKLPEAIAALNTTLICLLETA